ncbi:leucine-rich repeat domain-containing protein [Thiothrix winogradskyi]|uniref:non-specific serine/threonine protein kinase n=1 Tax=Thiothrix winogradskyi TaxID=96472 RepID=A0ABY3T3L3_9GAMM|nr:leucine-rich repeat domain-containing protein [Thiothrix winogradskyi]UJS26452.1 leucine-rich repeat domain-containing protein [Thiothrix winogradskyi]
MEFNDFPHLQRLNFEDINVNKLIIKDLPEIQSLKIFAGKIGILELINLPQLKEVELTEENEFRKLKLKNLPALKTLDVSSDSGEIIYFQVENQSNLESLNISNNKITDMCFLENLPHLKHLNLGGNQIKDASALEKSKKLETLDLSDNQVVNIASISHLTELRELYIAYQCQSNDELLLPISKLEKLETLSVRGNKIYDISLLSNLCKLQILDLGENEISDLSSLNTLTSLKAINLGNNKIYDISGIRNLIKLEILLIVNNDVSDISALKNLTNLKTLDFAHNRVSDISNLEKLKNLETLRFSHNQVMDLSILNLLNHLINVDCKENLVKNIACIKELIASKRLREFIAYGNPIEKVPFILLGREFGENCIEGVSNYFQDILKGSEVQQQLKIQFVGNGRVGKTTLAYELEHKCAPNKPVDPTHGIVIKEIRQRIEDEEQPVILQLWDFGGQEIYHSTHRLFLSDDCLYLLLWAEETEEHPDETRHPVSYWLEAIHDLAPNSPVILVKNQIDRSDLLPTRPIELTEDMPGIEQIRQEVKISAIQYRGIPALRGAIESVLEELKNRVCLELPTSWLQVQRELKQIDQETIPFIHFKQLCMKAGVGHAEWFADYLHKTGVLFYREHMFQDQVILDQNWAIEAVYRIFDPKKPHRRRIERMGGRFSGEDATLFWAKEEANEHEVYVDFMRNCGICYEPQQNKNQQDNKPFTEREFIIPALLPLTSKAKTAWGATRPDDWQLDIEYPFLHRSIIERIILRIGETYEGESWRTGIFCHTNEVQLLLECEYTNEQQSTQGRLRFHLRGSQLDCLALEKVLRKLVRQTSPHRRYQEFLRKGTEERAQLPEFKENPQMPTPLDENKPASKTVKLFISYSHADEAHKNELELCLKNIKRRLPLEYWDDRQMFAGELVDNQILSRLEAANIVVLLISRNFFASDYCFSIEMEKALKRYEQNHNVVIPIIIRPTDDWREFDIGKITALPTDGKPLSKWADKDDFWADVQQGIRKQVEKRLQT